MSRDVECEICGTHYFTDRALLPDGWMLTWDTGTTICDNCLNDWEHKWGDKPEYHIRGGEDEHRTIS